MSTLNRSDIEKIFRAFQARDLEAVMAVFADDALGLDIARENLSDLD